MKKEKKVIHSVDMRPQEEATKEDSAFLKRFCACVLAATMGVTSSYMISKNYRKVTHRPVYDSLFDFQNVDLDSIREKIYSSNKLSDEEKNFLYNPEFFEDVLPYINSSEFGKLFFGLELGDCNIVVYDDSDSYGKHFGGYYQILDRSIHINEKDYNDNEFNVLAHEFIHLCQRCHSYNVIFEACAEILSYEYYDTPCYSYPTEVRLVRKLMETIGPEPIKDFIFTGSFDSAEQELRKYFNNREYYQFTSLLEMNNVADPFYNKETEAKNRQKLDSMIDTLYERKYGYPSSYDPAIVGLSNPKMKLERYYFNTKKMDKGNTYYDYVIEEVPIKEAFETQLVNSVSVENDDYSVRYDSYDKLKGIEFGDEDILSCNSYCTQPVSIGVYEDGSLYAYTKLLKKQTLQPINKKFETDKIKTLKLY